MPVRDNPDATPPTVAIFVSPVCSELALNPSKTRPPKNPAPRTKTNQIMAAQRSDLDQATATIRAQVPLAELADFFSHAFSDIVAVLKKQGVQPMAPPYGKYYGQPGALVDVEVGFPVPGIIDPAGNVVPGTFSGKDCRSDAHRTVRYAGQHLCGY